VRQKDTSDPIDPTRHFPSARPPKMRLRSAREYGVLISPPRFEIIEVMRFLAPCTIAELAAELGRPPDTLYVHIRKLQKIGLVVDVGFRKSGRHAEQVFDLAADDVDFDQLEPKFARKLVTSMQAMFVSVARRSLRDAFNAGVVHLEPVEERNMTMFSFVARLTSADVQRIRTLSREIIGIIEQSRGRPDGTPYLWFTQLSPVVRERKSRKSKAKRNPNP
jgi:predicted transcriptional regulator